MQKIKVADIMTRDPICILPNTDLLQCAKTMVRKRVGSLLIVSSQKRKKKLVGFLAQKDILWALIKKSKADLKSIKAIDISPKKLATLRPEDSVDDALKKMKKLKFERLPVIYDNKLVGMVTIKDILNFHPEIYPELDEFEKIREESRKLRMVKKARERPVVTEREEGICEECGNQDILFEVDGLLICESCKNTI
ncbi:MAG: cyclic nucleotide-binding/CBS domain-containing protein [Candidatus Nanoarchaeia archaeon]